MKLIENKLPIILASSSGAIIHFSKSAMLITGGISLGESICNITNEDIVMKYSMYSRRLDIIETKIPSHPIALVKISGRGASRIISLMLLENEPIEGERARLERIFSLYSIDGAVTTINVKEILEHIILDIKSRSAMQGKQIIVDSSEEILTKMPRGRAELLLASTIFMLNEINFKSPIKITLGENNVIEFKIKGQVSTKIKSLLDIGIEYPGAMATALLIDSICEDESVCARVIALENEITVSYKLPSEGSDTLVVRANGIELKEMISAIIDAFISDLN